MCCTRIAEIQDAKIRHLRTIAQFCRAISSQLRHLSTIGKISYTVIRQYLLHISSQYGEVWPTSGWDRVAGLGHPNLFQRVSRLGFVIIFTNFTQRRSTKFCNDVLPSAGTGTLYMHFPGLLPHNGFLPGAKFTFRPRLAFFYIGNVIARLLTMNSTIDDDDDEGNMCWNTCRTVDKRNDLHNSCMECTALSDFKTNIKLQLEPETQM